MCKTIAIVNQKGGVAKTTTTNALGIGLANKGYRVLLIDLDSQGNLSMSLGVNFPDEREDTIAELLLHRLQENNVINNFNDISPYILANHGVEFIVGNDALGKIDRMMSGFRDGEYVLDLLIEIFKEKYDYIIIDCMPSIGNLTENAIVASDEVIIPSEPQYFSTKGIQSLFEEIGKIKRKKNPNLKVVGILPTKVDVRTNVAKEFMQTIRAVFSDDVYIFNSCIPISIKLSECNNGKNLYEYDANGKGVNAYLNFVDEYLQR